MKRFALLFLVVVFISCGTTTISHVEPVISVRGLDFIEYAKRDFWFSPEKYNHDYESLGIISVESFGEATFKTSKDKYGGMIKTWHKTSPSVDLALAEMYKIAKDMGGDGVMSLDFQDVEKNINAGKNGQVYVPGIKISGHVIKRK